MSADVWIETPPCGACGSRGGETVEVNITYNLSKMLHEAGFIGWKNLRGMPARKAGRHLLSVLEGMVDEPLRWRAMNPENGWGDYDGCLQNRLRKFATQCVISPKRSTIGASL